MFNFLHRNKFTKFKPENNNVLLIETNGCHGEVIGAYTKYFQELHKNVYILVTDVIYHENPFCRLNFNKKNMFYCKQKDFAKMLKSEYINQYDHIFVMSSVNYTGGDHSVADLYPDLKKHKSVFYVHHDIEYVQDFYNNDKKAIMLGHIGKTIYMNPHLFGDYTIPQKNEETIFVSVGGINPKRKNHTLLLNAIEKLHNKNYKFKVLVVGSGSLKNLNNNIKQHIKLLGHLDYDEMYDNVEKANFFLPLLDADNPQHDRYIKTQVTGSAQLIYGFRKVPVIHEKFAKFYKFNSKNGIIYQDLADGMEQAILSSQKDYDKYVKNLDATANELKQESLDNLKELLNA